MNVLKLATLCFASACFSLSSAAADSVTYEVRIQVRDIHTSAQYSVVVLTATDETEAEEFRDFLMFLFIIDFDKFEDESGLEPWESVDDILSDITVVTISEPCEEEPSLWTLPTWTFPMITINPNIGQYGPRVETGHSTVRTHSYTSTRTSRKK